MLEFTIKNEKMRLSKAVFQIYPSISYSHVMSLLRKKDVSINGKRVKEDVDVFCGDVIRLYTTVYTPENYQYNVETAFENEYIVIYWKPKGLETEGEISLSAYSKTLYPESQPCHRLDVNTDGFVIFGKDEDVKNAVIKSMTAGEISKSYLAALYGYLPSKSLDVRAFIQKDREKSFCRVTKTREKGSLPIRTQYKEIMRLDGWSVCEIKLFTGRTHQIRAQSAALGNYVLGDGKYCPLEIMKRFPFKKQALSAYKLEFSSSIPELSDLKGKTLTHECELSVFL